MICFVFSVYVGVLDTDGVKLDNKESVKMIVHTARAYVHAGFYFNI